MTTKYIFWDDGMQNREEDVSYTPVGDEVAYTSWPSDTQLGIDFPNYPVRQQIVVKKQEIDMFYGANVKPEHLTRAILSAQLSSNLEEEVVGDDSVTRTYLQDVWHRAAPLYSDLADLESQLV